MNTPAERVTAYLDAHDRLVPGVERDFISSCIPQGQSTPDGPPLTRTDLREVLRELDEARILARILARHVGAVTATALSHAKLGIDPLPD